MTSDEFIAARKAMGHTQHSLAVALRMGKHGWQTISGWENGRTPIPGPVQLAMNCLLTHRRAPADPVASEHEIRASADLLAGICQKARHSSASAEERDEALRDASEMLRMFARTALVRG